MNDKKLNIRIGQQVQIKDGAAVGQDHGFLIWKDSGQVFIIEKIIKSSKERYMLTADGYGDKDDYGNGSIFVNKEDLLLKPAEDILKPLDFSMNNVLAYKLGLIAKDVGSRTTLNGVGDEIDRGLILCRVLKEKGFYLLLKEHKIGEH